MKMWFSPQKVWFCLTIAVLLVSTLLTTAPSRVSAQDAVYGFCPFGVQIDVLVYKQKEIDVKHGITMMTGSLKVRLTNVDSGTALDLNIPGPGKNISSSDGATTTEIMTGPWLLGVPEGVLPDFNPRLFLSQGRVVGLADADGNWLSLTVHGNVTDLCAALGN